MMTSNQMKQQTQASVAQTWQRVVQGRSVCRLCRRVCSPATLRQRPWTTGVLRLLRFLRSVLWCLALLSCVLLPVTAFAASQTSEHVTRLAQVTQACAPTDLSCLIQQAINAASLLLANSILQQLNPLITWLITNPANFISQTPAAMTYLNPSVTTLVGFSLGVVDAALAVVVIVAGYNLMVGEQLGLSGIRMAEFVPRLILAVLGAHVSLLFVQWFIDLNNALCLALIQLTNLSILTQTVKSVLTFTIVGNGILLWVLALVLVLMTLLLAWQMLLRLAFLLFLIGIAPLGMLCFALPQTQGWGRLWLSNLSTTVFVQFFQVAMLGLGGMLVGHLLPQTIGVAQDVSLLASVAVFSLVLRLPGLLRQWALSGVADRAGGTVGNALVGVGASTLEVAPRLLALL